VRRELERIEIPGEHDARMRTWETVRAAYEEREPVSRARRFVRPLLVAAAAAALVAAAASPPGRAVIGSVGDALGVSGADESLFSLPDAGRLLVVSDGGAWTVAADGSKRRLGRYDDASWSPFGRFVVAARGNELVALEADGDVRWKLSRRDVRRPRWGGSRTDTRIAYLSGNTLRVVGGDGRGDRVLVGSVDPVAPDWRPATFHFLAYAKGGRVLVGDAESGRNFWSRRVGRILELEWSPDGELLLVRGLRSLRVFDQAGTLRHELLAGPAVAPVTAAAFSPSSRGVAFVQQARGRSHVWLIPRLRPSGNAARELFSGPGSFSDLAWSPNGRWLLVAWRDPNQWLFLSTLAGRRVRAVANVARQFESRRFPDVEGWVADESP
jgi:WD40 repeat protein